MTSPRTPARRAAPPPPPARRAPSAPAGHAPSPPSGGGNPRARALAILAELEQLKARIGADFYRMGQLLRELSHPDLYKALGYTTFSAVLEDRHVMSRFGADQLMQIVERYPAPQARQLGAAKAYALSRYAAATGTDPAALAARNVVIDGERLHDLSVRALQEAAARARAGRNPRPKDQAAREAERLARQLRRWLAARGAPDVNIRTRYQKAAWWIRLDLPAADLAGVIR